MTTTEKIAIGAASVASVAAIAVGTTSTLIDGSSTTTAVVAIPSPATATQPCNDWANVNLTRGECEAAGVIRYVGLYNLQGAAQFCKWKPANPGEWSRLNGYAGSGSPPTNIVTWLGASIKNSLEAYFVTGAPPMSYQTPAGAVIPGIQPNTAPNACKTPLAPPQVQGVTPGQTDATVTIEPGG